MNFVQNRRPPDLPGILDLYGIVRRADRELDELDERLRRSCRASGMSEREIADFMGPPARRSTAGFLGLSVLMLLARVAMLVVFNAAWFAFLLWAVLEYAQG